jgi:hypothetical protein
MSGAENMNAHLRTLTLIPCIVMGGSRQPDHNGFCRWLSIALYYTSDMAVIPDYQWIRHV